MKTEKETKDQRNRRIKERIGKTPMKTEKETENISESGKENRRKKEGG